jgi:hypothetical protein
LTIRFNSTGLRQAHCGEAHTGGEKISQHADTGVNARYNDGQHPVPGYIDTTDNLIDVANRTKMTKIIYFVEFRSSIADGHGILIGER